MINNIIKHANATQINIKLAYADQKMKLEIDDNGIGFKTENPPAGQTGLGLQNMNKRAAIVGGGVFIRSEENKGTHVTVIIPYP